MDDLKTPLDTMARPLIALMKGVVVKENDLKLWEQLLDSQVVIRDYVRVMGLELLLDESEGYAWLRTREPVEGEDPLPRLVGRRQLSYPVSLIIAILRKKLAETDVTGDDSRLILSLEEISDAVKVFFPTAANEARMVDKINTHLNKIADMGFIRRLKGQKDTIEVLRIVKAFVDAQWLSEFDNRLKEYIDQTSPDEAAPEDKG
ncbi:MAG: DUF4194 domain-containing protein [Proteobacteria bacterium]|nr:DUF4194 domain-containing protein [Pseudomonadota bacterium]